MNDPAITEEQAMALLEAELAAVEAKSASASSRAATRKKEREMLEMRDETCSPASNQKAAAEELTTEPRAQEPVVATAAENAWIARAESESSNDCMKPQKSASSRPTTEAEEHNTLLSSIKGGLTSLTTALADAVTTSDTNSTTCESKGTCTNSEGMEATKLERQLSGDKISLLCLSWS